MSDEWDSPAAGEQFVIKDYVGALCIFAVNEFLPQFPTKFGTNDALKVELVVLDGPNAGQRFEEAMLFGRALLAQLKSKIGGRAVLGRLSQNQQDAKVGQSAPYRLLDPTDDDKAKASAWVAENGPVVSKPTQNPPPQSSSQPQSNPQNSTGGFDWQTAAAQNYQGYPQQGPPPNPGGYANSYAQAR